MIIIPWVIILISVLNIESKTNRFGLKLNRLLKCLYIAV